MKLLFILNPEKKWARVLRRAVMVGVVSFLGVLLNVYLEVAPAYVVPVVAALLAAGDKFLRDKK